VSTVLYKRVIEPDEADKDKKLSKCFSKCFMTSHPIGSSNSQLLLVAITKVLDMVI